MARFTWRSRPTARPARPERGVRPKAVEPGRCRPRLEALEDRSLPSTFTVTNLHDAGSGSLRAAVAAANAHPGADTINFADSLHGTVGLTSGELLITDDVTVAGPGASKLSVSGTGSNRVFDITAGQTVTISDLTLSGDVLSDNVVAGSATGTGGRGGGLRSLDGNLTITDCVISGNRALGGAAPLGDAIGGGVYIFAGTATINGTTFSNNNAPPDVARGASTFPHGRGPRGRFGTSDESGERPGRGVVFSGRAGPSRARVDARAPRACTRGRVAGVVRTAAAAGPGHSVGTRRRERRTTA
jgi:hypothetical protein